GGGADGHLLALPGRTRELPSQDVGHVRLHPDRRPVTIVRGAVRSLLECPYVAERAAVDAAHVRVQGPLEAHALDRVEGALAGLFAILDPHVLGRQYRTGVRTARRRYSAADAAAADRAEARPLLPRARDALRHRPRARTGAVGVRAGRAYRDHPLPSRPRGRSAGSGRGYGSAGLPGRARLRAVRAGLGKRRLARAHSGV